MKFMNEELDEFSSATANGDIAKAADALVDLVYVALGTAQMMQIPFDACWRVVHRANMQKERASGADDARSVRGHRLDVVKPAGWQPPDIERALVESGGDKWDLRFMELAEHIATWSKDPSTKVGAVVVAAHDRRKISFGYNGFPPGIADTAERLADRETKLKLIIHGERNALDNCTFDADGATLYTTRYPCAGCALAIVSRRVARVVYRSDPSYEARWAAEVTMADQILAEAGIEVDHV